MKISHEVPLALLEQSRSFNDYDYALVHLFETEPEYLNFFKESIKQGREVILDNSVFELEEAFDADRFKHWIVETTPTYYIIPDVLDDSYQTIQNIKHWEKDVPGKTIGVIQGESFEHAVDCYHEIKGLVDCIAVSFNCKFYEKYQTYMGDLTPGIDWNVLLSWMNGRIHFVNYLASLGNTVPMHLLGCSVPQEFDFYRDPKFHFIRSVDTSNPIVHGINGIKYSDTGLNTKVSTKLIEYMHEDSFDMDLIMHNVRMFRQFCNG